MIETYPMAVLTAPGKVEFQERKLPALAPKDVLIGVKASAICGSDLHIFKGKHPFAPLPMAIGHELSGQVLETGRDVSKVKSGDRVTVEPVLVCGQCYFCRRGSYHLCQNISFQYRKGQGGFAPYFVAQEDWVHRLPENISYEEGALIEPLSVAVHAVGRAGLKPGETVAIFGAGAVGLLLLLLSKNTGASDTFVVDVQDRRLKKAKELGAIEVLNNSREDAAQAILEKTAQLGVDKSFEAVGFERTLVQSLQVLKKGGTSVLIGIFENPEVRIPVNLFIQREISLAGTQGYCWDFQTALKWVGTGKIRLGDILTHVLPLTSLQEGFDLLMDPKGNAIKVVVRVE